MARIAICDDAADTRAELEREVAAAFGRRKVPCRIDALASGEDLCSRMGAGARYDLIFLDIDFGEGEIDGVEAGRQVREVFRDDAAHIVYIYPQYSLRLHPIRIMDFLIKPLTGEAIERAACEYLRLAGLAEGTFAYRKGRDELEARVKDIAYLESRKRRIVIHFADGKTDEYYGTLKDAYKEQLREYDFLFIHASYLINHARATSVEYDNVLVEGSNKPLPISQKRRADIRKRYYEIINRRLGGGA